MEGMLKDYIDQIKPKTVEDLVAEEWKPLDSKVLDDNAEEIDSLSLSDFDCHDREAGFDFNLRDYDLSTFSFGDAHIPDQLEDNEDVSGFAAIDSLVMKHKDPVQFLVTQLQKLSNDESTILDDDYDDEEEEETSRTKRKSRKRKKEFLSSSYEKLPRCSPLETVPTNALNSSSRHNMNTRSRWKHHVTKQQQSEIWGDSLIVSNRTSQNKIGAYNPEARELLLKRFLEKRKQRVWSRKVKYTVRKNFADSRMRVKGRFISKVNEASLRECLLLTM